MGDGVPAKGALFRMVDPSAGDDPSSAPVAPLVRVTGASVGLDGTFLVQFEPVSGATSDAPCRCAPVADFVPPRFVPVEDATDITVDSFAGAFGEMKEAAKRCDFFAIDAEFTGITMMDQGVSEADSMSTRYQIMREVVSNYIPMQLGVCFFRRKEGISGWSCPWEARPFNLYLFPRSPCVFACSNESGNPSLMAASSWLYAGAALEFLVSTADMDLNKWVRDGVSFVDGSEEYNLRMETFPRDSRRKPRSKAWPGPRPAIDAHDREWVEQQ